MSRIKIAKVITNCNDCEHRRELIEKGGNTYYALVCAFSESKEESDELKPFLLNYGYSDPKHFEINIPDNCPLEDYDSNKGTKESYSQ